MNTETKAFDTVRDLLKSKLAFKIHHWLCSKSSCQDSSHGLLLRSWLASIIRLAVCFNMQVVD